MVDYGIDKVKMKNQESHIISVMIYDISGNSLSNHREMRRQDVVYLLNNKKSIKTLPRGSDGNLNWGDDVSVITIRGVNFIRTDGNQIEKDNLGELPGF